MFLRHITIGAHECAVEYLHGQVTRTLPAGRHGVPGRASFDRVDLRQRLLVIGPQEVPTADGVVVRAGVAVRWAVGDPVAYLQRAADPGAHLHLLVQFALRDAVAAVDVESLTRRAGADLTAAVAAGATQFGIVVAEARVRDVLVPHELRSATLELMTAKARGQAQLEVARAETAALRSLANGAAILDQHPALAQLRLVQALPIGAKVVLAVDGASDSVRD